jgi:hypothetical protein
MQTLCLLSLVPNFLLLARIIDPSPGDRVNVPYSWSMAIILVCADMAYTIPFQWQYHLRGVLKAYKSKSVWSNLDIGCHSSFVGFYCRTGDPINYDSIPYGSSLTILPAMHTSASQTLSGASKCS